jgi:hypothetical protein
MQSLRRVSEREIERDIGRQIATLKLLQESQPQAKRV